MDIAMESQWNHDPTANNFVSDNDYEKEFESYISDVDDDDGFDGGQEYSHVFQPEQHHDPTDEHQQLNEIFIEIPPPNIRLDLCPVCSRKFAPETLLKHVIICERVSTSRRTPFDSAKQRLNGPEFTAVAIAATTAQSPLTEKRLTPSRVSPPKTLQRKPSETSLKSTPAASTERMVSRKNSTGSLASTGTTRMITRSLSQQNDQCPHCGRTFGYRAFDRHVEWCKEKATLRPNPGDSTVSAARDRMKTRTSYKAPNLKTKRSMTRDKYSTSRNGSQNSLADFDTLLHSMSSSMTSDHGFYDPFLSAKKQLEELFSPTMANVEKSTTSESKGEAAISTPTTNMINSMMATPTPTKRENDSKKLSNSNSNIMTRSLTSYASFTPKTPQPLPRSQASNFKRTSSLRLSNKSKPKWTPPPPKSQNIQCGIEDEGPISPCFVKATDYDEIPVGSPVAATSAMKMYEGKIPVKIPPTKITAMPLIVNTTHTPLLRERHNLMSRKSNMKLDIRNPNQPSIDNVNALSKTDSLAMFLKYEKELTSKDLKDKSNCISKQNLTKDNKLPDINATSHDKRADDSTKESQSKSHSAPPLMKMINACDNLPSLMTSKLPANISDSDKSRSPSVDRKDDDENDSPSSTAKRGSGSALRRKMKYNLENILYDTDPEVKSNRSSSDNSNHNSIERPVSRLSNTESIFEDFDFDQFIASFNDDDQFPIFKDYKMMMNTKSKADEEMKISTTLKSSPNITKHENITNCNTKNVVKSLNDSFPIPIQSPPSRKLPEDDALSGFEKLDNLCKMLAGNSDSDENSLEADQNRSKSSADSAYGSYVSRQSQSPFDQRKTQPNPNSLFKPTPPIRQHLNLKTTEIVLNPAMPSFQETIMIPRNGNPQLARTTSHENETGGFYSKFCHDCGYKFVVPTAKFCIECGVRRVKI